MDPETLLEELLAEERRLRALAEAQVRGYRGVLLELARRLAPQAFDAQRRQQPQHFQLLSPAGWQAFFREVLAQPTGPAPGWGGNPEAHSALAAENQALHRRIQALERTLQAARTPPEPAASQAPVAAPPAADLSLDALVLPAAPPSRFARLFHHWAREGLVLALLARTGWSLRYAIDQALAQRVGIGVGSGSTKRLFQRLEKAGLVRSQVHDLGGVRAAILELTEQGQQVAEAAGFPAVTSEWATLMQAHGGPSQARHAALCVAFAYQARRRGWSVTLCPRTPGPAQPDVLLERGEECLYVEVEGESGSPERRMRKWRNQGALQGFAALCANTPGVRERLVLEARAAVKRGRATDIQSLIKGQETGDSLWVERW